MDMDFWDDRGDPFNLQYDNGDAGWGFGALDGPAQDWGNWFAGLDDLNERQAERYPPEAAAAPARAGPRLPPMRTTPPRRPTSAAARPAHRGHAGNNPPHAHPQPPLPAPNHSNNWLDPAEARRPPRQHVLPGFADHPGTDEDSLSSDTTDTDDTDYDTDLDAPDIDAIMPPTTRRNQQTSVVDLTNDQSSPPPNTTRSRKRGRAESSQASSATKRQRKANTSTEIEQLDLTAENPSAEDELLQPTTTAAATTAASGPQTVGQRTCIICMEPYTNATLTSCGHIYCHECLHQALLAGEEQRHRAGEPQRGGNCPVCRKSVDRKKDKHVILVNFMKKGAWRAKGRPAMEVKAGRA